MLFMKIEFQNSIRRLSFFEPSARNQNCLDKFFVSNEMNFIESKYQAF